MRHPGTALVIVDVQNDFCEGGALAVPGADDSFVEDVVKLLEDDYDYVVVTRDWHPPNHHSFKERGGEYPAHCVQWTDGAALSPVLERALVALDPATVIGVLKGQDPSDDGYDAARGVVLDTGSMLEEYLLRHDVRAAHVCGLAEDKCVRATAIGLSLVGLDVTVLEDATRILDASYLSYLHQELEGQGIRVSQMSDR